MLITQEEALDLLAQPALREVEDAMASDQGLSVIRTMGWPTISGVMNDLYFSPYGPTDVLEIISKERSALLAFSSALHATPDGLPDCGEFAPGEEPGPEDYPSEGTVLGLGTGVAVTRAVTFLLLRDRPRGELLAFLKGRGYPFAVKYAKHLRGVFAQVKGAA